MIYVDCKHHCDLLTEILPDVFTGALSLGHIVVQVLNFKETPF